MTAQGLIAQERGAQERELSQTKRMARPPAYVSDIWRAPLTDLPIRDEILFQYLPLPESAEVLEIGPGSGFTAFRFSRLVKQLAIVDIAAENIERLRLSLKSVSNLDFTCWDVSVPGLAEKLGRQFDVVESIEVLEFVPKPATALCNIADALRPGGTLFLQFPNYRPSMSHGVTFFEKRSDLDGMLERAGFQSWEVFQLNLRPFAGWIYRIFHEKPLNFYRRKQQRNRPDRPQTYESVWTFKNRSRLERYRSVLNVCWTIMITIMRLGGDCFRRTRLGDDIMDRNLLVIARR
jgi:SAM-dependent methyltransferase